MSARWWNKWKTFVVSREERREKREEKTKMEPRERVSSLRMRRGNSLGKSWRVDSALADIFGKKTKNRRSTEMRRKKRRKRNGPGRAD